MLNVLIIMPKTVTRLDEWYVFPTGVAYVSSALKSSGICNVYTYNLNTTENEKEKICTEIDAHDIDVIATGGLSVQYHSIRDVIITSKKHKSNIITMVGGGYITSAPIVGMTAIPEIDIGIIGEGEITICETIKALRGEIEIKTVNGLILRGSDGELYETEKRLPIKDLDSIEFPDYDGFDFESTLEYSPVNYGIYNKRAAVLITSRGCPFNCSFCFHPQGDSYRTRSLDNVFKEIEYLKDRYRIRSLLILDELFGGNSKRLKEFCKRIKKYNLQWWVETRVQFATKENLKLMKESGCVQVLFGIENINNCILESMKKHITFDEIEAALKNSYDVGISAPGVLLFGDPAETKETAEKTIKWWKEHPEYNIVLTTVQVYPGSEIWDYAISKGLLPTLKEQVEHIVMGCPKLNLTTLPDEDFSDLCKRIGVLNQSRNLSIQDSAMSNEQWNKDKLIADVTGKCFRCGTPNFWPNVSILAEGGGAEPFICCNCGQSHANNFMKTFYGNFIENCKEIQCKYKKVALWGQGRKLVKLFEDYKEMREMQFYYVDSSPVKWNHEFYGLRINKPESIAEYKPDILIIAVGDANASLTYDQAKKVINSCGCETEFYMLGELMKEKKFQ